MTHQPTDLPARLEAALTERYTSLGNPFSRMRRQEKGPDGWPAEYPVGPHHVAEVLRELLADEQPAAAPVCICGHPNERHFEDVCQTCGCGDYLEPQDAAEVIARWRQAALKVRAGERAAALREAADRFAAFDLQAEAAALRRMADETATETPDAHATHPCNAATLHRLGNLATAHGPHLWVMQPGMDPVRCPGTRKPAAGARVCKCPPELCACGHHQPAAGARQDGAET